MNKKKWNWLKVGAGLAVFALMLFLLNSPQQRSSSVETDGGTTAQGDVDVKGKMNIAIVNEDDGTAIDNVEYDLGSNYIKQIEKDDNYNWYVVSRGSAESGLNEGLYQLMLIIPNHFSAKILDLEDTNPEKVSIQYSVNANGNNDLEAEANRVGNEIVNGLNQQLVDVYVATILVNLSQAQGSVQDVVVGNNSQMLAYENEVFGTALNFENALPSLKQHTGTTLEGNERLTNTLVENTEGFNQYSQSLLDYDTQLQEYIAQLNNGLITEEEFLNHLLSMDAELLNEETQSLFQSVQASNNRLAEQFKTPAGPVKLGSDGVNPTYASEFARLQTYMNEMNEKINQQEALIDEQLASVNRFVDRQLAKYYKSNGVDNKSITLKEFLMLHEDDAETQQLLEEIAANEKLYQDAVKERVASLPFLAFDNETISKLQLVQNEEMTSLIETVKHQTDYLKSFDAGLNDESEALKERLKVTSDALKGYIDNDDQKEFSFEWNNKNGQIEAGSEIRIDFPEGLKSQQWFVNGKLVADSAYPLTADDLQGTITVSGTYVVGQLPEDGTTNGKITVQLVQEGQEPQPIFGKEQPEESEDVKETPDTGNSVTNDSEIATPETNSSETNDTGEETLPPTTNTGQADTSIDSTDEEQKTPSVIDWIKGQAGVNYVFVEEVNYISNYAGYRNALNDYSKVIGEIERLYKDVFAEIGITSGTEKPTSPTYSTYSTLVTDFLDRDIREYLTEIVGYTLTANLKHFDTIAGQQINVQSTMNELTQQMPVLAQRLAAVRETATVNAEQIESQLQLLNQWQEQAQNLTTLGTENADQQQESVATATDIQSQLSQLLQTSGTLREDSESTVELANSVTDVFESFDQDVSVLEASSEELSTDAASLMNSFQQQIQENNQFASGFVELLNNTHSEGVLNESVMDFIANPVQKDFKGSVEAAETIKPFTWVLLIYGISLFAGYLVATNQLVFVKKDDFDSTRSTLKQKGYPILIVLGIGLVLGVIEGVISGNILEIPFAAMFLWVTLVTMLSMVFALVNYGLIYFMKNIGLGLSIYFLISYVFVTEAIRTATQTTGFVQIIRNINPLMWGEKALSSVLNTQIGISFALALAVFAMILGGLLFAVTKKPAEQEVA